jgi:hypothetical protein
VALSTTPAPTQVKTGVPDKSTPKTASGTTGAGSARMSSWILCPIVDCGTAALAAPAVLSVNKSPIDPNRPVTVTPGGTVVLNGNNFADKNGQFGTLVLLMPYGFLQQIPLQEVRWGNRAVMGTIPALISGVRDTITHLQVRRSDGVLSAPVPVQFRAQREFGYMSTNLPQSSIQCSNNADQNQCNSWSDFGSQALPPELPAAAAPHAVGVFGVHNSFQGSESGVDHFNVSLKNGWVVNNWGGPLSVETGCAGDFGGNGATNQVSASFVKLASPSDFAVTVQWTSACQLEYGIWVGIEGPAGVPAN